VKFLYKVFNLIISSEIEILHLPQLDFCDSQNLNNLNLDVEIVLGQVPDLKEAGWGNTNYFFAENASCLILQFLDVGRFLIQEGKKITVMPFGEPGLGTLSTFLMGSVMGGLLHQRGYFLLHGNAVVYNNQAYIFAGESGAGKSTLAAAFSKAGAGVLSDDVSAIIFDESGQPWVLPAYPAMKLWQDAADYFSIETKDCHSVVARENKYHVPYQDIFCREPKRLAGIYVLEKKSEIFELVNLGILQKIENLILHTHTKRYLDVMGLADQHLKNCLNLAKSCPIYKVNYPHHRHCKEALMKLVCPGLKKAAEKMDKKMDKKEQEELCHE